MIVEVERRPETVDRRSRTPRPPDDARIIRAGTVVVADGRTALVVVSTGRSTRLFAALADPSLDSHWQGAKPRGEEARMSGIQPKFIAWGSAPPQPMRSRYGCTRCVLDRTRPDVVEVVHATLRRAWMKIEKLAPDEVAAQVDRIADAIHPDWIIDGLPFTSGVINDTAAIPYHTDASNLRDAWSVMLVSRRGVDGGLLHVPSLDAWVECADGDAVFFKGQSEMHGVSPLRRASRGGRRFTIVAYVKSQMRQCWPINEEHARAAAAATEANRRKAARAR